MVKKILLNNNDFRFKRTDLPCLIHGREHSGSSLLTVVLVAKLYKERCKILFISGYEMARQEFINQIKEKQNIFYFDEESITKDAVNSQVVFIKKENIYLLEKINLSLADIKERVVLIKNIDLFDESVYSPFRKHKSLILSGDLDNCCFAKDIVQKKFKSCIFFSQPELIKDKKIPELNKYEAYFTSVAKSAGVVKISK